MSRWFSNGVSWCQKDFLGFQAFLTTRLLTGSSICSIQIGQHCGLLNQTALMIFSYVLTSDKNSGNPVRIRLTSCINWSYFYKTFLLA